MTPLAIELQRILDDEAAYPPLSVEALAKTLHVLGYSSKPVPAPELEAALGELVEAGSAERLWSRGAERYRTMRRAPAAPARPA